MPKAISTAPVTLSSACRTRRPPQHVTGPRDGDAVAAEPRERHQAEEEAERERDTAKLAVGGCELRQEAREEDRDLRVREIAEKALANPAARVGRADRAPLQARARLPDHASRSAWKPSQAEVERPHELQRGERRLRPAEDGRDPDRGRERPDGEAAADPERRREREPAAAEERVPDDERGVRSRARRSRPPRRARTRRAPSAQPIEAVQRLTGRAPAAGRPRSG